MNGVSDVDPDHWKIKGLQVLPSQEELAKASDDGYQAASEGKPQSDCPIIRSKLVVEWIKGWKAWHESRA